MAYMLNIAKARVKFERPSWVVYDQNLYFRSKAANTPTMDWSKVDPSIYSQCFSNMAKSAAGWCQMCYSIDHCTESQERDLHPQTGLQSAEISTCSMAIAVGEQSAVTGIGATCARSQAITGQIVQGRK